MLMDTAVGGLIAACSAALVFWGQGVRERRRADREDRRASIQRVYDHRATACMDFLRRYEHLFGVVVDYDMYGGKYESSDPSDDENLYDSLLELLTPLKVYGSREVAEAAEAAVDALATWVRAPNREHESAATVRKARDAYISSIRSDLGIPDIGGEVLEGRPHARGRRASAARKGGRAAARSAAS